MLHILVIFIVFANLFHWIKSGTLDLFALPVLFVFSIFAFFFFNVWTSIFIFIKIMQLCTLVFSVQIHYWNAIVSWPCRVLHQGEEQPDTELFLWAVPFILLVGVMGRKRKLWMGGEGKGWEEEIDRSSISGRMIFHILFMLFIIVIIVFLFKLLEYFYGFSIFSWKVWCNVGYYDRFVKEYLMSCCDIVFW